MPRALPLAVFILFSAGCPRAPAPAPRAEAPTPTTLVDYDLSGRLLPDEHRLEVDVKATLPAVPRPRTRVRFALRDDLQELRAQVEAPAACAGELRPSVVGRDPDLDRTHTYEAPLPRPCPAGAPVALRFRYAGGAALGFQFYLGPEGSFAGAPGTAWYPRFGERRARGSLRIAVPRGYVVRATGTLQRTRDVGAETVFLARQLNRVRDAKGRILVALGKKRPPSAHDNTNDAARDENRQAHYTQWISLAVQIMSEVQQTERELLDLLSEARRNINELWEAYAGLKEADARTTRSLIQAFRG